MKETLEWEFFITLTWRNNESKIKIMFCIRTATTSFNTVNILVQKFMCHRTNKNYEKKIETKIFPIIWERFLAETLKWEAEDIVSKIRVSLEVNTKYFLI